MKFKFTTAAAAILAVSLFASYANAGQEAPPVKKHVKERVKTPSVQQQIQEMRQDLQNQIDSLKQNLASKDAELNQAKQAAADAQAAADKANAAATASNQAVSDNASAVTTLQSTVTDLKGTQLSLATTVSDETEKIKKEITNPAALYYKGITISPAGSFIAAETVWRNAAIGDGLNTHFTSVPLQYADNSYLSEFQGSGRQSRLAIKATGKLNNVTLTGYYEMDWLGAGITSNNNQSNSYVMRQRQIWAQAALRNGWTFTGGQMWSLATETTKGLQNGTEILPSTIDPQYEAGFIWTRQYGFRVTKNIGKKAFFGISAENAEMLNPAGSNLPGNIVGGVAGDTGGLYNSSNNYTFNVSPDLVAKVAIEPGWGHWEAFGIGRFFRDRIYPNNTGCAPGSGSVACTGSAAGAYNSTVAAGGIGGDFRGPLLNKKITIGLKGLWGQGVGRYGSSTIADATLNPDGNISPLYGFSALSTLEMNPTKRLTLYFNYGGDYIDRQWTIDNNESDSWFGKAVGYGIPGSVAGAPTMTGCNTEVVPTGSNTANGMDPSAPGNCKANTKDVQEATAGYWYNIYNGPKGRLRYGLQYSWIRRDLWSGAGGGSNPNGGAYGTDNMVFTSFRYYLP